MFANDKNIHSKCLFYFFNYCNLNKICSIILIDKKLLIKGIDMKNLMLIVSLSFIASNSLNCKPIVDIANRATENILDSIDTLGNALKHNIDILKAVNQSPEDFQEIEERVFKIYKKFKWEYELITGKKIKESIVEIKPEITNV